MKATPAYLASKGRLGEERFKEFEIFRYNLIVLQATKNSSAQELSKVMNLKSLKRVEDYKLGRAHPDWDEVRAIAKFFDVTIDQLMYRKITVRFEESPNINTRVLDLLEKLVGKLAFHHSLYTEEQIEFLKEIENIKNKP